MRIDHVICSSKLFTGEGDDAAAGAVAIAGDTIAYVGSRDDAVAFAKEHNDAGGYEAARVIDYGDALIVPGFHDSHVHFFHSAVYSSPLATNFLGENEADCV